MPVDVKTPVGRIVWGDPSKSQIKKDPSTKQPILRDGKPVEQWAFGVAIPKAEFQQFVWPAMAQEAATGYPGGVPAKFSWKYVDGDGVDGQGKPYNTREGYAGCYILTITTEAFAPPIFKLNGNAYVQLSGDQIKTGDYVVCAVSFKVNVPTDRTHTPGLYVNPVAIEHVGYGQPIYNGPDAQTLFGGQQYQLPPGASAMPVAAAGAPGMPGTMQPGPQPGQMPGMQMQPGQMPAPAHDFTQNAGMQPAPQYQPQPGMMPGR